MQDKFKQIQIINIIIDMLITLITISILILIPATQPMQVQHPTHPNPPSTHPHTHTQPLVPIIPPKSPNDKRTYQALVLPNKLKLLLIHDDQIAKSACSISVGVGSLFDKQRSLGLAHFLQHMLFMGSKKYPLHNQYSSFISTNSGLDNAYTSDTQTNYYFQIKNTAFYQAVQRLTNFFNGALLQQQCIQKQSQAVHQQYILWTNDDNCRKWQILRKMGSAPYSRFNIGNTQTLRHQHIRQDLVSFYNQYYSANIINAVVCSNYSIQQMKNIVIPFFQAIPNKQVSLNKFDLHFTQEQTAKFINMQSIKDQSIIQLFYVVQYLKPFYKQHIDDYITHVVGHQGKNSLLSILKMKKYASQLSAYSHDIKSQTIIGIQIKLTQIGSQNYIQVYNIVMDYMSTLKSDQSIYQQIKQKKIIQFQFKQKQKISSYVCKLSSKMHDIPLNQILNSSALFQEYNQDMINRILRQLNPFNVVIVYSNSQELDDPIVEKYLGAKYQVQKLPQRNKSNIIFQSMPKNRYIPINTKLLQFNNNQLTLQPQKLTQNIYFLQDSSFRVCKGGIQIKIYSTQNFQFIQFYTNYLNLLLKQLTYPAQTLNCKIQYQPDDCLIITVFGFSDTVIKMLEDIAESIEKLHQGKKSQILFQVCIADLIEVYENFYNKQSDQVATDTLDIILTEGLKRIGDSLEEFRKYQYKSIQDRIKQFWKNNIMKWVIVGNFDDKQIKQVVQKIQAKMKGTSKDLVIPSTGCLKLKQNAVHEIVLESQDLSSSCALVYYQVGPYTEELYYKLLILKNHIDEPFFNQLRTIKQMAYYLRVTIDNTRGILGLYFFLVSSTRDPKNISDEIKNFVEGFFGKIQEDLTGENKDKFITLKQSVFTKIKAPHNNLKAFFEFITDQITEKKYYFTRKQEKQIKKYLDPIQVADLKQVWQSMKNNTLQIYVVSQSHKQQYEKNKIKSEDVLEIKQKQKYWNDFFKCI